MTSETQATLADPQPTTDSVDGHRRAVLQAAIAAGAMGLSATVSRAVAAPAGTDTVFADGFENAQQPLDGLTFTLERATPEQIGLYLPTSRTFDFATTIAVRYKPALETTWKTAHPLARIRPADSEPGPVGPVDAFAGSIFDLVPGQTYELELTISEPAQSPRVYLAQATTRALPPPTGAANKTATPANLVTQLANLNPGDVLELAAGTYADLGLQLTRSGTAAQPITIRGASKTGTVLSSPSRVLQLLAASYLIVENLTIRGSNVNSGTNASSRGIEFWDGAAGQTQVTFRDLIITGVDVGIKAYGTVNGVLVYNCEMTGNNTWTQSEIESNATWNDDGICLPGQGNCAFNNTLRGFGDSFAVIQGVLASAVYYYRNRIAMTGDDAFEADYGTRNLAFYDNHISNCATLLSVDPVYGGPLYCFRNVVINTIRGPFKLNSTSSGFFIYNNTIVRTEGTSGWGWVQFNNGALRNWGYRNNVLVYRGASGNTMAVESTGCDPIDFTHNAWFPDRSVWWSNSGASYNSVTAAIGGAGQAATTPIFGTSTRRHQFDVLTTSDPFTPAVTMGATHLTEVTSLQLPAIATGASPKNAGVAIPNITDGFTGAAPDMGALIAGRAVPNYGVTAFTAPYALPGPGQVVAIGVNNFDALVPPELSVSEWNYVVWLAWCAGIAAPDWSPGGAYVAGIASGGHGDGRNFRAAVFDFTDARWKRLDPTNPNAESNRTNHNVSQTSGSPYYEITGSNGVPAARHQYQNQVWLPPSLGGGTRGSVLLATGAAVAVESVGSGAAHRAELGANAVTYSRFTNSTSMRATPESCSLIDVARSRVWILPNNIEGYNNVEYLDLLDRQFKSTVSFPWPAGGAAGGRAFMHQGLLLKNGEGGQLFAFDPDNATAGWQALTVSGTLPNPRNMFVPWRGKFWSMANGGGSTITRLTPPSGNVITGTWTVSTVNLGGAVMAAAVTGNNHLTCLSYVASIDCLAWVPGGSNPVYLIRPE